MFDGIMSLEKAALDKLTNERRVSGSISSQLDDTLSHMGVYWDTVDQEYFSMDEFQCETFERLIAEYVSQDYA